MRAAVALRSRLVARARPQIACCAQQLCLSSDTKTANPGPNVTEMAAAMPRRYYEMSNTALLQMAVLGDQHAREERLIREIMAVDNVSWDDALPRYHEMEEVSKRREMRMKMPYYLGIGGFYFAGFASIPLCFHLDTVKWFNHHYVTTDVPSRPTSRRGSKSARGRGTGWSPRSANSPSSSCACSCPKITCRASA